MRREMKRRAAGKPQPMGKFLPLFLSLCSLASSGCSDDVTRTYTTKYRVYCAFLVASYPELMAVVNNPGQFGTLRQSGGKIVMAGPSSTTSYTMDALQSEFLFGCGGLVVGTDYYVNLRAYDLACPNCDRNDRRLTLNDDGTCQCAKCGIVYDMNNDGAILDRGDGTHSSPRALYRYPITWDGSYVRIIN